MDLFLRLSLLFNWCCRFLTNFTRHISRSKHFQSCWNCSREKKPLIPFFIRDARVWSVTHPHTKKPPQEKIDALSKSIVEIMEEREEMSLLLYCSRQQWCLRSVHTPRWGKGSGNCLFSPSIAYSSGSFLRAGPSWTNVRIYTRHHHAYLKFSLKFPHPSLPNPPKRHNDSFSSVYSWKVLLHLLTWLNCEAPPGAWGVLNGWLSACWLGGCLVGSYYYNTAWNWGSGLPTMVSLLGWMMMVGRLTPPSHLPPDL